MLPHAYIQVMCFDRNAPEVMCVLLCPSHQMMAIGPLNCGVSFAHLVKVVPVECFRWKVTFPFVTYKIVLSWGSRFWEDIVNMLLHLRFLPFSFSQQWMTFAWIYHCHDGCQMTTFHFYHSFRICQLALFCKAEISLFFHLFIYIHKHRPIFLFYAMNFLTFNLSASCFRCFSCNPHIARPFLPPPLTF